MWWLAQLATCYASILGTGSLERPGEARRLHGPRLEQFYGLSATDSAGVRLLLGHENESFKRS